MRGAIRSNGRNGWAPERRAPVCNTARKQPERLGKQLGKVVRVPWKRARRDEDFGNGGRIVHGRHLGRVRSKPRQQSVACRNRRCGAPCRFPSRLHIQIVIKLVAYFAVALLLGGMVFFAAVVAPLVFTRLPPEHAGRFIRALFPFYYLYVFATATVSAIALAGSDPVAAGLLAIVAAVTLWLRQGLMGRINRLSDNARAGDKQAQVQFDRAHRLSVIVNMAQLLAVAWSLVRLA